jgi:hypothetical protein
MLTFGAESPRDVIDQVTLTLHRDDQGFVCLGVTIRENLRVPVVQRTIRIGQQTATDLGRKMISMAEEDDEAF